MSDDHSNQFPPTRGHGERDDVSVESFLCLSTFYSDGCRAFSAETSVDFKGQCHSKGRSAAALPVDEVPAKPLLARHLPRHLWRGIVMCLADRDDIE